ncbi:BrnT family toxin [Alloacidobacterium dinghuense]|uniref:BrnT family toxin n=1 Tax=Alloacidobacterium dinghuense TaxID=2763107 RepID=UPI001C98959D
MEFEWDSRKAASNRRKHGIPFPFAARVFLDENRMDRLDEDSEDREERWITLGSWKISKS